MYGIDAQVVRYIRMLMRGVTECIERERERERDLKGGRDCV